MYNFNTWYFTQKSNIHNIKCISSMPVKISSCFMLIFSSLLFAFYTPVFLINFKTTPDVFANLKLILHDYIFPTSINNITYYLKHILLLSGDIEMNPVNCQENVFY